MAKLASVCFAVKMLINTLRVLCETGVEVAPFCFRRLTVGLSAANKESKNVLMSCSLICLADCSPKYMGGRVMSFCKARYLLNIWEMVNQNEESSYKQRFGTFINTRF